MNEDLKPRLFADDAAIRRIGAGLLACTLAKSEWTHEAHLAASLWLIVERPDVTPERDLPAIIRRFNESAGGVNDDSQGYHETITRVFLAGIRLYLARIPADLPLAAKVNGLLRAPEGRRDWPFCFYSRQRLLSVPARLGWLEPDLRPLP